MRFGLLRSDLPFRVKAESVFHLTGNLSYLLMALVSLLIFPAILARAHTGWYKVLLIDLPLFLMATFAGLIGLCVRQGTYFPVPFLMMFGFGFLYVGAMSIWQGRRGEKKSA